MIHDTFFQNRTLETLKVIKSDSEYCKLDILNFWQMMNEAAVMKTKYFLNHGIELQIEGLNEVDVQNRAL